MFARDVDLLVYEPGVFGEVRWLAQTVFEGAGLSVSAGGDEIVGLPALSVVEGQGYVLEIDGHGMYELVSYDDAATGTVARVVGEGVSAPTGLLAGGSVGVVWSTFQPQLAAVHAGVLRSVGLTVGLGEGELGAGQLGSGAVMNADELVALECFGALHTVYAGASSFGEAGGAFAAKAEHYRQRFARERERVRVEVDLNDDGAADAVRRLTVMRFVRG